MWLAFLCLLSPLFAQADLSAELDRALGQLEKNGLKFIGNHHYDNQKQIFIKDLRAQATKIKVVEMPELKKPAGATRHSAFFHAPSRTIYVSSEIAKSGFSLRALAIHEALGALGLPDQNYQVSVALSLLLHSQDAGPSEFQREVGGAIYRYLMSQYMADQLGRNWIYGTDPNPANQELALNESGGTLVGGGGDLKSLVIKENFALQILTQWHGLWNTGRYGSRSEDRQDFFLHLLGRLMLNFRVEPKACAKEGVFYAETSHPFGGPPRTFVSFPPDAKPADVVEDMLWYWKGRVDWEPSARGWHPHAKDPEMSDLDAWKALQGQCKESP